MPRTGKKARGAAAEPAPLKYPPQGRIAEVFTRALQLARALPGVEEGQSYGTPAIKVKGKLLGRLRSEAEGGLALRCDMLDREMLLQVDPEVFYITEHYANYPMILINLTRVRWEAMPGLLEQAWRMVAPARLVKDYDAASIIR